jgi:hypothetical protein
MTVNQILVVHAPAPEEGVEITGALQIEVVMIVKEALIPANPSPLGS